MSGYSKYEYLHPEAIIAQLNAMFCQDLFVKRTEAPLALYKVQVVSFDTTGGALEELRPNKKTKAQYPGGKEFDLQSRVGPPNPPRAIRGRIITSMRDQWCAPYDLRIFWPMFPEPNGVEPCIGDFVYVMFEDAKRHHGLWLTKCAAPNGEDPNQQSGSKTYEQEGPDHQSSVAAHGENQPAKKKDLTQQRYIDGSSGDSRLSGMFTP